MIINAITTTPVNPYYTLGIRCPGCGRQGTFESVGTQDLLVSQVNQQNFLVGLRTCPHTTCRALVYYICRINDLRTHNYTFLTTFPFLRIDFDHTSIPDKVLAPLEEAITCHSNNCFVASAIMIRKTLELLCSDRNAIGDNLKQRIASLGGRVLIPKELLEGMDELRLLGNDAAHIESQVFDTIGKQEVEVAVEFTKEILKAVYQYSSLLTRLRSLKKNP